LPCEIVILHGPIGGRCPLDVETLCGAMYASWEKREGLGTR
jgi:hypothetical protein